VRTPQSVLAMIATAHVGAHPNGVPVMTGRHALRRSDDRGAADRGQRQKTRKNEFRNG